MAAVPPQQQQQQQQPRQRRRRGGGAGGEKTEQSHLLAAAAAAAAAEAEAEAPPRRLALYVSHFFFAWSERMWEFATILLMADVFPNSLALVAASGLTLNVLKILFLPVLGAWLDGASRLPAIRTVLCCKTLFIVLGFGVVYLLFQDMAVDDRVAGDDNDDAAAADDAGVGDDVQVRNARKLNEAVKWVLVCLIPLFNALAGLSFRGATLVVEKDWVVVMCRGAGKWLSETNATMRRLDLVCKMAAPGLVGVLYAFLPRYCSILIFAAVNVVSVLVMYLALRHVYDTYPALQEQRFGSDAKDRGHGESKGRGTSDKEDDDEEAGCCTSATMCGCCQACSAGYKAYLQTPPVLALFAFAMLYMTVLNMGGLMTAYLKWQGLAEYYIGIARGIGATCGLLSTFFFPAIVRCLGVVRTTVNFIWLQVLFLSFCILSFAIPTSSDASSPYTLNVHWPHAAEISFACLIGGALLSRVGLWTVDLSITQIGQELIAAQERGLVNGFQHSVMAAFEMCSYIIPMVVSDPSDFWLLAMISYGMVVISAILFTIFGVRQRVMDDEFAHIPACGVCWLCSCSLCCTCLTGQRGVGGNTKHYASIPEGGNVVSVVAVPTQGESSVN